MNRAGKLERDNNGFPKSDHIKSNREIREAYAQGRRYVGKYMVLWLRQGENESSRLGVVTSRKVGNAVKRNHARRLLREVYRTNRNRLQDTKDIVLVARKRINSAKFKEIEREFIGLAKRAGLTD